MRTWSRRTRSPAEPLSSLSDFPRIALRIGNTGEISRCLDNYWPQEPHPLVFLLWIANDISRVGHHAVREILDGVEQLLDSLNQGNGVTGDWKKRGDRMFGLKNSTGEPRYREFQTALFELIVAHRLAISDVTVRVLPDGASRRCDLDVTPADGQEAIASAVRIWVTGNNPPTRRLPMMLMVGEEAVDWMRSDKDAPSA